MPFKSDLASIGFSGVFGSKNMELEKAFRFYSEFGVDWYDFVYDHVETSSKISEKFTQELIKISRLAFEKGGEVELRKMIC